MTNKRTKEQKKKAQQQRSSLTSSQVGTVVNTALGSDSANQPVAFSYTAQQKMSSAAASSSIEVPSYVAGDLKKTAVVATLLFIVLVGIYSYLRYN
jgi:preprotein translocase subunit SecF